MNAGRLLIRREKERQHAGHGHPGVPHANEDFLRRRERLRNEDGGGLALFGGGEVGFLLGKSQVAGPGAIGGGEAREPGRTVTDDFALELFRNLSSSKWHRMMS